MVATTRPRMTLEVGKLMPRYRSPTIRCFGIEEKDYQNQILVKRQTCRAAFRIKNHSGLSKTICKNVHSSEVCRVVPSITIVLFIRPFVPSLSMFGCIGFEDPRANEHFHMRLTSIPVFFFSLLEERVERACVSTCPSANDRSTSKPTYASQGLVPDNLPRH